MCPEIETIKTVSMTHSCVLFSAAHFYGPAYFIVIWRRIIKKFPLFTKSFPLKAVISGNENSVSSDYKN